MSLNASFILTGDAKLRERSKEECMFDSNDVDGTGGNGGDEVKFEFLISFSINSNPIGAA